MAESVDTMQAQQQTESDDLARTIAVAGLQVSQAADELKQAAAHLMDAEEHARDAEARRRTAEEQMAQGASKNAELLDLLSLARQAQSEAEERARSAEQPLQEARGRPWPRPKSAPARPGNRSRRLAPPRSRPRSAPAGRSSG